VMKTILLLTDFSKKAEHAAEFAFMIASKTGADIILYNAYYVPRTVPVVTEYPFYDEYSETEKNNLEQLKTLTDYLTQKMQEEQEDFRPPPICHINEPGNLSDNIENIIQKKQPWMIIIYNGRKKQKKHLKPIYFRQRYL
jgi:nucleotide-binding universal stress UspA family protein